MQTIRVYWKDKFGGKAVIINAVDFNAEIHRYVADGPWPKAEAPDVEPDVDAPEDLHALTVAQLRDLAEERGVELAAGLKKAEIIEAIEGK